MAEILRVESLWKRYGNLDAVRDVSFTVERGEIFGMIGPNGAGKTTTIECCLGLRRSSAGTVTLLGLNPYTQRRELFHRVGVQLQETSYQEHVRVGEICGAIASLYDQAGDWRAILDRFGLAEKESAKVESLSGGQRQRLTIALALIPRPELVFLDELTTGLDPRARREMWDDIRALRDDGVTIFMTTHYMEEAEHLCDRVAIIRHGSLLALDTVDALIEGADLPHEISFEADDGSDGGADRDVVAALAESVSGVRSAERSSEQSGGRIVLQCDSQSVLADLIRFLDARSVSYKNVRTKSPGLDELFLKLTEDAPAGGPAR